MITLQYAENEEEKETSIVQQITSYIGYALNIELSSITFDICPITGLTTAGKGLYQLLFITSIFIGWILLHVLTKMVARCCKKLKSYTKPVEIRLIRGLVEIIKYTYASFCSVIFMSVVCVELRNQLVWFYDGNVPCFQAWQYAIITFAIIYAIPFPLVLLVGMKLLQQRKISSGVFFLSCLFPLVALCVSAVQYLLTRWRSHSDNHIQTASSQSSEEILSVLQGPYRRNSHNEPLYWEAIVTLRRLLLTGMQLVPRTTIRMIITVFLCVTFLIHHTNVMPFTVRTSNHIETISLCFLIMSAVFNLLKGILTESGITPAGPNIALFKRIEFIEKMMVILLILSIIIVEIHRKIIQKNKKKDIRK